MPLTQEEDVEMMEAEQAAYDQALIADLRGASLDRAIFEATDLTRADLRDTSLVEAI